MDELITMDWLLYIYMQGIGRNTGQLPLLEVASGSLIVGGLSTPLREYSLHLRAAAAALFPLSFTSSSVKTTNKHKQ